MRDKAGDEQQTHSTGYTYLRLQTQPLTPSQPCSTKQRGTGGPWPGSACGLIRSGRKEDRESQRLKSSWLRGPWMTCVVPASGFMVMV